MIKRRVGGNEAVAMHREGEKAVLACHCSRGDAKKGEAVDASSLSSRVALLSPDLT